MGLLRPAEEGMGLRAVVEMGQAEGAVERRIMVVVMGARMRRVLRGRRRWRRLLPLPWPFSPCRVRDYDTV